MRGGKRKEVFPMKKDIPEELPLRHRIILAIFENLDIHQIDGLEGDTYPLTSSHHTTSTYPIQALGYFTHRRSQFLFFDGAVLKQKWVEKVEKRMILYSYGETRGREKER